MRALYDYLMNEVPAQNVANRDSDISWPLSMRWPLAVWNQLFHDDQPYQNRSAAKRRVEPRRLPGAGRGPLRQLPRAARLGDAGEGAGR